MTRDQPKRQVLLGLLGTTLDQSKRNRWSHWRPSVAACQHESLPIDRFELLHFGKADRLLRLVSDDIRHASPETEVGAHQISIADPWDFEEVFGAFHQFARDYPFDTEREEYLVHITTGTHVAQICLFLLTESRHLPARLLQTSPSKPRKESPSGNYRVIDLDLSRYDELARRFAAEREEGRSFLKSGIDTKNRHFNTLIDRIERVCLASRAPILLCGPTGAGKSHLAERIFQLKRQRQQVNGSFIAVNCATIRGDQAMSTLFGHVAGAFTGAAKARNGLLRSADGGILFLDEIGELGLDEQAMLLRAVEEKRFTPVGADSDRKSDFQLLAGTNRDLNLEVNKGRFREDLLARINLWEFELPGLTDRREDIEPNIAYELDRFTSESGEKVTMNREARRKFLKFALSPDATWPANFRDLSAAITRMATLAQGGRITTTEVDDETQLLASNWQRHLNGSAIGGASDHVLNEILTARQIENIDRFDRCQLAEVINVCRTSRTLSEAGRRLFQASRLAKRQPNDADRLRKYLARFELDWHTCSGQAAD